MQSVEKKLKPLEIINIEKVDKVLSGKMVQNATEQEFSEKMKVIYLMIGLRPHHFPADEEKSFLHNYIFQKYGNKTLNELVLAFDLAIQGQLEVDDVKVYDQFTCEYFAKIMTGYRQWLMQVVKNSDTLKNQNAMQVENKTELSLDEWAEWINDAKKYPFELIPNAIYDFLVKQGAIILSNDQKHVLMGKAITYASSRLEGKEFTEFIQMKSSGVFSGHYLATLITLSKRFAVKEYFENN